MADTQVALAEVAPGLPADREADAVGRRRWGLRIVGRVAMLVGCLVLWFALVGPDRLDGLTPRAFVRLPLEAVVLAGGALLLPPRVGRVAAAVVGVVLAVLAILRVLDMVTFEAVHRSFKPEVDAGYVSSAVGVLSDSIGRTAAIAAAAGAAGAAVVVLLCTPWSLVRLTRAVRRHRTTMRWVVPSLGVLWVVSAVAGVQIVRDLPVASTSAAGLAFDEVSQLYAGIQDQRSFEKAAAVDVFRDTPAGDLLTGLRGKDVVIVFVESYGRVAVQGSAFSPQVDAALDAGTSRLASAGFSAKSAFLTSSTFGGISWLAHASLQSGLWIDNQVRYDTVVSSDRLTLSGAFKRAGWRTVSLIPAGNVYWPQGRSFYHYDELYNSLNIGYAGPRFSYAPVPDQFTLAALQRLELAKPGHPPVMAEVDLVSSHTPWAPLPRMVDPAQLGDGSVFDGMPEQGQQPGALWKDPDQVRAAYGQSIEYSLDALTSFVETSHDDNLVLVVLGDHQPATIVSGADASHDVPVTVIAHDPAVMGRISGWGWQDGLRPGPDAPVWRMDTFRDRFLSAYGPTQQP